ncbi:hypothetical protein [Sinorhizobium fredii]|uniref:hypothetical protein n=1 Tax=Rhizobium fredii TaxID=380 RepID=UPI001296F29E|nr:hypothetical protein [Sinorhizobium fredii]MQW94086.1 hypothetical protein [Sinorhizobium fredii]
MSTAASLSLLQGGKKPLEAELEKKVDAVPEPDPDEEVIDVDKLSAAELDKLVKQYEIAVPENWAKMKVGEKRSWLKSQFDEVPDPPSETAGDKEAQDQAPTSVVIGKPPLQGEVVEDDVIIDLAHEIENMKEKDARQMVTVLADQGEVTNFKLGGVLSLIQANKWFEPYASFQEYIEKEHGLNYRKAIYFIGFYNDLVESKVPWEKVKGIGWTKLKEIAGIITPENVDEWVEKAMKNNTITLIDMVKKHLAKDQAGAIADQSTKTLSTKTFKMHQEQRDTVEAALSKAKDQSGTTVDTVALEYICLEYLGGQTLEKKLQSMGIEAALAAVEKAFPNAAIEVALTETEDEESAA